MNSSAHIPAASAGSDSDSRVATGRAPIEATSLRFTARDLRPSSRGEVAECRKWTPSASMSVVKTSDSPSPTGSTAQSSPIPSNSLSGRAAKSSFMWSMNPNSVMVLGCVRPRRLACRCGFAGFSHAATAPGGGPASGWGRSLYEPRQGRGRRLKSLFNGRCRTKVLKIL